VSPDFTVTNIASLDTALETNCTGGVVAQTDGPPICVVRYGSIHVTPTAILTIRGNRALALVADHMIVIDGVLDVSANGTGSGPGGGTVASGGPVASDAGGGGAGFATAGGAGGSLTVDGGGGVGGSRATDPAIITALVGGTIPTRGPGSVGAQLEVELVARRP
jgi:hypothetical protein